MYIAMLCYVHEVNKMCIYKQIYKVEIKFSKYSLDIIVVLICVVVNCGGSTHMLRYTGMCYTLMVAFSQEIPKHGFPFF